MYQPTGAVDSLDAKIERLIRDWNHGSDMLFSIHPSDGSLLVWLVLLIFCISVSFWLTRFANAINSQRNSVCSSVTLQSSVQTNEDTIVQFSASCRKIILVSGEVKFIRIFADHPSEGVKVKQPRR